MRCPADRDKASPFERGGGEGGTVKVRPSTVGQTVFQTCVGEEDWPCMSVVGRSGGGGRDLSPDSKVTDTHLKPLP